MVNPGPGAFPCLADFSAPLSSSTVIGTSSSPLIGHGRHGRHAEERYCSMGEEGEEGGRLYREE